MKVLKKYKLIILLTVSAVSVVNANEAEIAKKLFELSKVGTQVLLI